MPVAGSRPAPMPDDRSALEPLAARPAPGQRRPSGRRVNRFFERVDVAGWAREKRKMYSRNYFRTHDPEGRAGRRPVPVS
jgi:hypothetical protein